MLSAMMDIFAKAARLGIEPGYVDAFGRWRDADPVTLRAVIAALGKGEHDEADAHDLPLAVLKAFSGNFDRVWMLAVQLYGVRSQRNWGIGDFSDLLALIDMAGTLGAAGIGLNPMHALFDAWPDQCSPYAPNSRLFLNPLYIDVGAVPECPAEFLAQNADTVAQLRASTLVDYEGVAALKRRGIEVAFKIFKTSVDKNRDAAFETFRNERGNLLSRFAAFEVLHRRYQRPWWEWPEPWRAPDDGNIAQMHAGPDQDAMDAVAFAQWCADAQLCACRDAAEKAGMPVGLYLDLAVGVRPDGFDAWNEQVAISRHLSVGAPPDLLNTAGQNWGLAGFNTAGLVRTEFAPFRAMLRSAMRYAGAIRIDHVMGLKRLYVIPHGHAADDGVYIRMPFEALLAICAEESRAHRSIIIGEDLGTVPDGFRETLADWDIWSCRVMMFERNEQGAFKDAQSYPAQALVSFETHDLASFEGWRTGHDLATKRALGIDPGESDEARRMAIAEMKTGLHREGIACDDVFGVVTFLALTSSRILAVMIEDVLAEVEQPNVPGTVNEHPNWRRKLPVLVEDFATRIEMAKLAAALEERRIKVGTT